MKQSTKKHNKTKQEATVRKTISLPAPLFELAKAKANGESLSLYVRNLIRKSLEEAA